MKFPKGELITKLLGKRCRPEVNFTSKVVKKYLHRVCFRYCCDSAWSYWLQRLTHLCWSICIFSQQCTKPDHPRGVCSLRYTIYSRLSTRSMNAFLYGTFSALVIYTLEYRSMILEQLSEERERESSGSVGQNDVSGVIIQTW